MLYKYYNLDIERPALPNLEAWYARLCERPAYQLHAMIPFGSSPQEWLELEKAGA
jgi:glutathione S-transferase